MLKDNSGKEFLIAHSIPVSGRDRLYGFLFGLLAIIILLSGFILYRLAISSPWVVVEDRFPRGFTVRDYSAIGYLGILLFTLSTVIFIRVLRFARRYSIDFAKKILKDSRLPVLYLRAFSQDSGSNTRRKDLNTHEELIAKVFADVGPLLAVGKPLEDLPPLGALRLYFKDDEWKQSVSWLMESSSFTIIQPTYNTAGTPNDIINSTSEGLRWEVETSKEKVKGGRLLFSFLIWQDFKRGERQLQYQAFKAQIESLYHVALPEKFGDQFFMYFDNDYQPQFIYMSRWKRILWGKMTVLGLRAALKPYISSNGHTVTAGSFMKEFLKIISYRLISSKFVISLNVSLFVSLLTDNIYVGGTAFIILFITYVLDIRPKLADS